MAAHEWPPEMRAKISVAKMGHPTSAETRTKISATLTGRKLSPEHREKIIASLKGRSPSAETRRKLSLSKSGEKSNWWRGGRVKNYNGYICIYAPNHPHANCIGYVYEHRLVMERKLGRFLLRIETVHHINGVPDDNREENLSLFPNNREHMIYHRRPMPKLAGKHSETVRSILMLAADLAKGDSG